MRKSAGGTFHLVCIISQANRRFRPMIQVHRLRFYVLSLSELPGGRNSWEFMVGVCRPVLQLLTLFNFQTRFQTWRWSQNAALHVYINQKSCHHVRLIPQQNDFEFAYYSFFLIYLESIHTGRSSFVNHTQFQTKMGKIYTRFQIKTSQKPVWGGTYLYDGLLLSSMTYII